MSTQTDFSRPADGDRSHTADNGTGAQDKAQQAAQQAQAKAREQLDQRTTQLGEQVNQQASDLRSVSQALREQGQGRPAQIVDRMAVYAEQVGRYLHEKDADAMLGDAEDFGRQKPAAAAAGALALGFAASRFLKASSAKRYSTREPARRPGSAQEATATGPASPPAAFPTDPAAGVYGTPAQPGI